MGNNMPIRRKRFVVTIYWCGYFLRYICVAVSVRDLLRSAVCILTHISGVEQDK